MLKRLNRQLLKRAELPKDVIVECQTDLPERVIQFGEGNFLRGFVDWMIHQLNRAGKFSGRIVAVQPTPFGKVVPKLNKQDGLYTVVLRGVVNGDVVETYEIISSVSRGVNPYTDWQEVLKVAENKEVQFVFSNTTEAGLTYLREDYREGSSPQSFPGKLTAFLYHRYRAFDGDPEAGMTVIPCELVEDNGDTLRDIVLQIAQDWNFPEDFIHWIQAHNRFCNTLVDRIVTGYPDDAAVLHERLGYYDELLTVGEPYHLFAIDADGPVQQALPFHEIGLNVSWGAFDVLRDLKVRILNGAHTMMFAVGYLSGANTVRDVMDDDLLKQFVRQGIYEEVLPSLNIEAERKTSFADTVLERFSNPFNAHFLVDIGMNATNKFRTRLLPTLADWVRHRNTLPDVTVFSLAALIAYYHPVRLEEAHLIGSRGEEEYRIRDGGEVIRFFYNVWEDYKNGKTDLSLFVQKVLGNRTVWGTDLNELPGLSQAVHDNLRKIERTGVKQAVKQIIEEKGNGTTWTS